MDNGELIYYLIIFRFFFKQELFTGFHTPPKRSIRAATDHSGGRVSSASMIIFYLFSAFLTIKILFAIDMK
jgi:hypothetical protein